MDLRLEKIGTAAAILAGGLILAAIIGSFTFYRVRAMDNTLAVTGSATQDAKADSAKWTVTVSRSGYESELPVAQNRISKDVASVVAFFQAGKIASDKIMVSPASTDQEYSSDSNAPRRYTLRQQITVRSDTPEQIAQLAEDIGELTSKGIVLSVNPPEYYVSNLPQIRVALIGKAVEDARARAVSIAKSTGQSVGALKSASSGVVQVMSPNSVEVADYGSYDTSTIEKQVMVTARAVFYIR